MPLLTSHAFFMNNILRPAFRIGVFSSYFLDEKGQPPLNFIQFLTLWPFKAKNVLEMVKTGQISEERWKWIFIKIIFSAVSVVSVVSQI